jgi:hypothetical protein
MPRTGPQAGQRLAFAEGPVSFGRAPENTLVLEGKHVSRYHGVLRLGETGWVLENRSPNGTTVDRRPVGEEGSVVGPGRTVGVGERPLLELPAEERAAFAPDAEDRATARRRRYKRYAVLLGGYFLGLLALGIFLMTLEPAEPETLEPKPALSKQRIQEVIRRPVERAAERSAEERRSALQEARQLQQRPESQRDARYQAYAAYRRALAHTENGALEDGLDQQRYHELEQRLAEALHERYQAAYRHLRLQRYAEAERAFRNLLKFYPNESSPLYEHILHQLKAVKKLREQVEEREREGF